MARHSPQPILSRPTQHYYPNFSVQRLRVKARKSPVVCQDRVRHAYIRSGRDPSYITVNLIMEYQNLTFKVKNHLNLSKNDFHL